jgi:hypothetical protein
MKRDINTPIALQYYVDRLERDLTIPSPGDIVWIDIEAGCFQDAQQVRDEGTEQTAHGLVSSIYCNKYSLQPVFGDSSELAAFGCKLIYADYRPPDLRTFEPFNGWEMPEVWQYASAGLNFNKGQGIVTLNCDLLITPDGRVGCDISNYTDLTDLEAQYLRATVDFVCIGLQNATIARRQKEQLLGGY